MMGFLRSLLGLPPKHKHRYILVEKKPYLVTYWNRDTGKKSDRTTEGLYRLYACAECKQVDIEDVNEKNTYVITSEKEHVIETFFGGWVAVRSTIEKKLQENK